MEVNSEMEVITEATEDVAEQTAYNAANDTDVPLDKNVRLMSPTRMVVRRFFRSKLSIVGLVMVISLFVFSFALRSLNLELSF